ARVDLGNRGDSLVAGLVPPAAPGLLMGPTSSHPDPISRVVSSGALRPVGLAEAEPARRHHPTSGAARSPPRCPWNVCAPGHLAGLRAGTTERRTSHMPAAAPKSSSRMPRYATSCG